MAKHAMPQNSTSSWIFCGLIWKNATATLEKVKPRAGIVMPSSTAKKHPSTMSTPSPGFCSRIVRHKSGPRVGLGIRDSLLSDQSKRSASASDLASPRTSSAFLLRASASAARVHMD